VKKRNISVARPPMMPASTKNVYLCASHKRESVSASLSQERKDQHESITEEEETISVSLS